MFFQQHNYSRFNFSGNTGSIKVKLRNKDVKLIIVKYKFCQKLIEYLMQIIDEKGLHKNSEKIKMILEAKESENVNQLSSFIGVAINYNKFIPRIA